MFESKWVWAKGNNLRAWGELTHKQNDKKIINFRLVGWCVYFKVLGFSEKMECDVYG